MDADHPESDADWNRYARHETETQRLDRNWASILQELRVVQTGVQLLTGFLLFLPFQVRFAELSTYERSVYLVTVFLSISSTILLLAPVGMHRVMFRQRKLRTLVSSAHRLELSGLLLLGLALTGVVMLIAGTVIGPHVGAVAGAVTVLAFSYFWILLPWLHLRD
ncbi:DUF6328 family protein [Rhodococcus daqingensis]|uniref:DUF6328 family protein n=1 Tax=Rhodococcus daqingensis TaxID=2479363 RepID=A0ABW2S1C3_9NOCA